MKLSVEKSPFNTGAWVVSYETLVLCNPEEHGGRPIEWLCVEGAKGMVATIEIEGRAPYQLLYKTTAADRLTNQEER